MKSLVASIEQVFVRFVNWARTVKNIRITLTPKEVPKEGVVTIGDYGYKAEYIHTVRPSVVDSVTLSRLKWAATYTPASTLIGENKSFSANYSLAIVSKDQSRVILYMNYDDAKADHDRLKKLM